MSILSLNKFESNFNLESIPTYESLEYQFNNLDKSLERVDKLYTSLNNVQECISAMESLNLPKDKMVALLNKHQAYDLIGISKTELDTFSAVKQYAIYQEGFFEFVGNVIAAIFNAVVAIIKWIIGIIAAVFGGGFSSGGGGSSSSSKESSNAEDLSKKYRTIISTRATHKPFLTQWVIEAIVEYCKTIANNSSRDINPFANRFKGDRTDQFRRDIFGRTEINQYVTSILDVRHGLPSASIVLLYFLARHQGANTPVSQKIDALLSSAVDKNTCLADFINKIPNSRTGLNVIRDVPQAIENMSPDVLDIIEQQTGISANNIKNNKHYAQSHLNDFMSTVIRLFNNSNNCPILYDPNSRLAGDKNAEPIETIVRNCLGIYRHYVSENDPGRNPYSFLEYKNDVWDVGRYKTNNLSDLCDKKPAIYLDENTKGDDLKSYLNPDTVSRFLIDMATLKPEFEKYKDGMNKLKGDLTVIKDKLEQDANQIDYRLKQTVAAYRDGFTYVQNTLVSMIQGQSTLPHDLAIDYLNSTGICSGDDSFITGKKYSELNEINFRAKCFVPFLTEYIKIITKELKLYVACIERYNEFVEALKNTEIPTISGGRSN